ncbi:MAG: glutamate-5-semialdehyde dehydrogenase [Candidatus Marinimicrobia bacterium]|nr:glutamate-5-semialdehyde dehydrogenase [Candidatus Neomarinimicrobiota bacterium]
MTLKQLGQRTKQASKTLPTLSTEIKQSILKRMAANILKASDDIKAENLKDLEGAREQGLSSAMIDRLTLTDERISAMADSLLEVAGLEDPVGAITEEYTRPNGLLIQRRRIPLGVIGVIYESRPNVTVEAASLCFYAGNGLMLRGGSEAFHSNQILVQILKSSLAEHGLEDVINMAPTTDRSSVDELAKMNEVLDVIIPRGGEGLIRHIYEIATVPVIAHYKGNCHMFIDQSAIVENAVSIAMNSKAQRPGVCNALETLLVHENIAGQFLPEFLSEAQKQHVEIRGCSKTQAFSENVIPVTHEDFDTEFLDLILAVKVVPDLPAAINHIQTYTSDHTEVIVSEDKENIETFIKALDSSAIIVNASTRFNDGGQLGLGAEIGISTTKLHSFGPMGLRELTTTKFVVTGSGQLRI